MSKCMTCWEEMDDFDAQQHEDCSSCRKRVRRYRSVRKFYEEPTPESLRLAAEQNEISNMIDISDYFYDSDELHS